MSEIAFLLDARISSDMLSQVEILAQGCRDTEHLRARIVIFGPLDSSSAVARSWPNLNSSAPEILNGIRAYCLPRPRGLGHLDVLSLAASKALAGCSLLHCFSLSLLDTLAGLLPAKMLPPWCLSLSHWPGEQIARKLNKLCAAPSPRIICFTGPLQQALLDAGVSPRNCQLILPEPPPQRQAPSRSQARKQLGLSEDMQVLLADPQISFSSNHRHLTWACAIIGQFMPRLRVLVAGRHPSLAKLRAFDDSLNPPSLGIYPAERFAPELLYAASDLLVLPATGPISPIPLLRAGRAGLPVVASDTLPFRQYLRHEHNALLFSPGPHTPGDAIRRRIRPLASAVVRLLEDRNLAKRLSGQLTLDISAAVPSGKALPAHLEFYHQMLHSRRPANA